MRAGLLLLQLLAVALTVDAANILAPIWFDGSSHFVMFGRLFKELAARGHNVTVISHFPLKSPLENYHDIAVGKPDVKREMTWELVQAARPPLICSIVINLICRELCLEVMGLPQVQQLLHSGVKFDLVIAEFFHADCTAALAHWFQAPLIGITSSMAMNNVHDRVGNPDNPAYAEQYVLPLKAPFSFLERVVSSVSYVVFRVINWTISVWFIEKNLPSLFGGKEISFGNSVQNVSLVLVNSHWSFDQPLPTVPAFIEVGGLHVEPPRELPQELRAYLEGSRHGVIYFSLGSMLEMSTLPADILKSIIDTFAAVPQNVLWKVDASSLPPLPPNVRAQRWMPQNDILNHPNVLVFITHGGLMGTQEAIMAGVPMLTIPFFGDQYVNAAKAAAAGVGITLDCDHLSTHVLRSALDTLINDTRYRDRAQQLSALFRDRPRPPLEEAVYWVEYVIRHKGAGHLRSAALDLPWYQYLLLDVAALVLAVVALATLVLYLAVRSITHLFVPASNLGSKVKTS